jgi:hypothetical protein
MAGKSNLEVEVVFLRRAGSSLDNGGAVTSPGASSGGVKVTL